MNTKVTTETFNEIQKIFIKVTDENLSYQELEAALLPYNRLPLLASISILNTTISMATTTKHLN